MSRRFTLESALEEIEREARNVLHHLRQGFVEASKHYDHLGPEAGRFQPRLTDLSTQAAGNMAARAGMD